MNAFRSICPIVCLAVPAHADVLAIDRGADAGVSAGLAQEPPPELTAPVNDFADVIDPEDEATAR